MRRPTLLAALAALLLAAPPAAAENAASGHFESKNWNVPLEDAYAFRDASLSGDGRAILVAISNFEFGEDSLDRFFYRRHVLDKYFADDETRVAYLEFSADGRYLGYSYFFGSGDGCGWCGGGSQVKSSVEVERGRIKGRVTRQEEDRGFDVRFDVPIAPDDYGQKQGPGGGEAGKAWLAYHAAAEAGDAAKLRTLVSAANLARWKQAEAAGNADGYLRTLTDDRFQTASVREAFLRSDHAVLLVSGESRVLGKLHGEVQMDREGGAWRVETETLQLGAE